MIIALIFGIGGASQLALLAHHVQRGEPWIWDAAVAALCLVSMFAHARTAQKRKDRR